MKKQLYFDLYGKKYLIGIDPGFDTLGICIYDPKTNDMKLFGGDWYDGIEFLGQVDLRQAVVVLENPSLDSATFRAVGIIKPVVTLFGNYMKKIGEKSWPLPQRVEWGDIQEKIGIALRMASNMGENKAAGKLMKKLLARHKVVTIEIAPSDRMRADKLKVPIGAMIMPTKANAKQFETLTGYTGRSNEHARDAATLVWGKDFRWAENQLMIGIQDNAAKTREKSRKKNEAKKAVEELKQTPKSDRKFFNVVGDDGAKVYKGVDGKWHYTN